jgi:hypothetical protein
MSELNPYAAPKAGAVENDAAAEQVRRQHLRTESHLKAVGLLILFGGTLVLMAQWMMGRILAEVFGVFRLSPISLMMALLPFVTGAGLFLLKPWAWKAACLGMVLLIILGLLNLPRGIADVVIHASLLRFLLGSGPRSVFQADYQDIIRRTPLLHSQPATWVYILMATVTVLLAFAYGVIRR